jgi:hypothetical protein
MAERFQYEGEVRLLCQEGGMADYEIELRGIEGEPLDLTHKFAAATGEPIGKSLAQILANRFAAGREPNRFGDVELGPLRITIERVG